MTSITSGTAPSFPFLSYDRAASEKLQLLDRSRNQHSTKLRLRSSIEDLKSALFYKAVVAEFIATFFLVFFVCATAVGDIMLWSQAKMSTLAYYDVVTKNALVSGFTVATIIWAFFHLSNAHINPAVSLALLFTRKISLVRALVFTGVQCAGALVAVALLSSLTGSYEFVGGTQINKNLSVTQGFLVEFVLTFMLGFTIFSTFVDQTRTDLEGSKPLTVGICVAVLAFSGIPFTGASMNPARSFGPAIISGDLKNHWVYWIAPIIGCTVAGLLYDQIFQANASWTRFKLFLFDSLYDCPTDEKTRVEYYMGPSDVTERNSHNINDEETN